MGMKYMISAFRYPWTGVHHASRQTRWLPVAIFWLIFYSIKYDAVDLEKRGR